MLTDGQSFDVLEDEEPGFEVSYESHEVVNEMVAGIVEDTLTDHAETLARRAAKYHVNVRVANLGVISDVPSVNFRNTAAYGRTVWKIKFVCGTVNRVVLDSGEYVETCLLEAEAHPPGPGEEINSDQSSFPHHHPFYRPSDGTS